MLREVMAVMVEAVVLTLEMLVGVDIKDLVELVVGVAE